MEVAVVATHEYQWLLFPLMYLYHKYWSTDQIAWYGDRLEGPLPGGVEFRRVPCYAEGVWPWEHWFGNGLMSILEALADDVVLLLLPDQWPVCPVDVKGIAALEAYMRAFPDVVRGNLLAGTCLDSHGVEVAPHVVQVHPGDRHCGMMGGTAMAPALWNRRHLRAILEPHWDLWSVEKLGTEKMAREWPRWRSVGTRPALMRRSNPLRRAEPRSVWLEGLGPEDRGAIRSMVPEGWRVVE